MTPPPGPMSRPPYAIGGDAATTRGSCPRGTRGVRRPRQQPTRGRPAARYRATACPRMAEREPPAHDRDDPVSRAHVGAERDGPVEPLGGPARGREVPALGEVRVLRGPQRGGHL